jgi:hypothetical protein
VIIFATGLATAFLDIRTVGLLTDTVTPALIALGDDEMTEMTALVGTAVVVLPDVTVALLMIIDVLTLLGVAVALCEP